MDWIDRDAALRRIGGANAGSVSDEGRAAMAAALRRAAERRCPSTSAALIREARASLSGLLPPDLDDDWESMLQELVGLGDIIEGDLLADAGAAGGVTRTVRRFFAHPSALVEASQRALLVGVDSDPDLRDWGLLGARLHRRGALRILEPEEGSEPSFARRLAKAVGLPLLDPTAWARAPAPTSAAMLVGRYERLLAAATPSRGSVQGLRVVCAARDYKPIAGEQADARFRTYVGSTQGSWGGRPWCFMQLTPRGDVERLVELPLDRAVPGFGEAWRLALALAAERGEPGGWAYDGSSISLSFPAPPWVARQLDLLGERRRAWPQVWVISPRDRPAAERILKEQLWMTPDPFDPSRWK